MHLAFAFLAATALLYSGSVCLGSVQLVGKPFLGVSVVQEGLINPAALDAWGARKAGFAYWDRVIAVDGELVFSKDDIVAHAAAVPIGTPMVYQVRGLSGDTRFVEHATRLFTAGDLVRGQTSQAVLGLLFVCIATALYLLRPGTAEAWSFFFVFAATGMTLGSVADMTLMWRYPPIFSVVAPFLGTLGLILVGVLTRSFSKSDTPDDEEHLSDARLPRRRMWALILVCWSISTLIAVLLNTAKDDVMRYVLFDGLLYAWLGLDVVLGLGLLTWAYARGQSPRRRARLRQILWAWPVGAGLPVFNLLLGQVLEVSPFSLIWNGFLLLVPISTADAIVRHDLLRLSATARRLVGGLTVAAVVGMALGVTLWSAVQFLHIHDAPAMVAMAALLFAIAAPLSHRVQTHVEGLLRQRRYDAARLLADFTGRASTATHLPDVLLQLKQTFDESIQPVGFTLFRLEREPLRLVPQDHVRSVVLVDAAIAPWLERSDPWIIDDEQPAPPQLKGAALVVRLAVANEPVGMLVVQHRLEHVAYEAQDVGFVLSLAGPLAAALVNALAFDAVERLNRELEKRVALRTSELEDKNEELALLNQRKDELVATVSHDFRSPLTVIRQNAQTILRDIDGMDREDLLQFVTAIARQEDRLTALCTNLLDLARLKGQALPDAEVDVGKLVVRLRDDAAFRAQAKSVELQVAIANDAPLVVRGDETRLAQVFANLIDNALKFTPAAGTVTLTLARANDGRLEATVADTGCGVPADALPRLFEPFFQVPNPAHAGQGSGLGLAIVRAVIIAHGGEIAVTSTEGTGTSFRLLLPGNASNPMADTTDPSPSGATFSMKRK